MDADLPRALNATEITARLAKSPFATAVARGATLVVGAGEPPRVVFATPSALAAFGARDLPALAGTLLGGESPGARRLRQLMRALPLDAPPSLQSLRFYAGRRAIPVGWLCARIAGLDGEDWLVAAAPVRPVEEAAALVPPVEEAPAPDESTPPAAVAVPEPESPPFSPMPLDGPVRFLWSCDGESRFGATDAALTARLGTYAPRAGETPESLRERIGFDPGESWGAAIAARRTFAGLRIEWPEPDGARARVAALSGAPIVDRERGFAGFRGFGIFTGEAVALGGHESDVVPPRDLEGASTRPAEPIATDAIAAFALAAARFAAARDADRAAHAPAIEPAAAAERALEAPAPPTEAEAHGDVVAAPVDAPTESPAATDSPVTESAGLATTAALDAPPPVEEAISAAAPPVAETLAHQTSVPERAAVEHDERRPETSSEEPPAAENEPPVCAPSALGSEAVATPEPLIAARVDELAAPFAVVEHGAAHEVTRAPEPHRDEPAVAVDEPAPGMEAAPIEIEPIATAVEELAAPFPGAEHEAADRQVRVAEPSEGESAATGIDAAPGAETAPIAKPPFAAAAEEREAPLPTTGRDTAERHAGATEFPPEESRAATPIANPTEGHESAAQAASAPPIVTVTFDSLEAEISAVFAVQFNPLSPEAPAEPDDSAPNKSAPARVGREGGAEIYLWRPPAPTLVNAPNVVPIRPGALVPLTTPPEGSATTREEDRFGRGEGDAVELTTQERDAFREIARALGVRGRESRAETTSADPTAPPADGSAAANAKPWDGDQVDMAALVDMLPIGVLVTRGGDAVYLNRTLLDLVGYASVEAFRADGGLEHIFRGRDPAALVGGGGDLPLVAAGGELMNVDAQARPITWVGEPAIMIALRRSRMVEHQAALRAVERDARAQASAARDLAQALDIAADGMIRLDDTGRILGMNRRAETLLGYDQKEAAGESFLMLLSPANQAEATAALDRVTREPVSPARGPGPELIARDRGGRAIPVRTNFGRLSGAGAPEYFVLLHDLSRLRAVEREREAARDAAEKASARKTDFLARVSHEIRTPLHAILGFAEVIIEERFGPIGNERYKDYIKDIHASGRHVMSLANDLLDLAKIEAGKMELQFAPVDVNKIIRECVALMQPQAARERIIMRLSLLDKLPNVMADERSLRQIMLNLMSNAVKFNEPGGQVIVSTALDEAGHAVIRVRDTGVGMNDSELGVALEPFRRVAGGARDGTGLGLPLTKALAEANHADFSIKSRKEHGTLVELAFPRERAAQ